MRLLVASLLVVLVALAVAEPISNKGDKAKSPSIQKPGRPSSPSPLVRSSSSHRHSSSHRSSSSAKDDAKKIARQIQTLLPTRNGSAFFSRGGKLDRCTVAEKAPTFSSSSKSSKSGSSKSSSSDSSKSGSSKSSSSKSSKSDSSKSSSSKSSKSGSSSKLSSSSHSSSKRGLCDKRPSERPLFDFKHVASQYTSVGIRKKHFREGHHKLIAKFANEHESVLTVVVVDTFADNARAPLRRTIKHKNLVIFQLVPEDKKGHPKKDPKKKDLKQVFPASAQSSSSRRSSSSQRPSESPKKPSLFDKLKDKAQGFKDGIKGIKDKASDRR